MKIHVGTKNITKVTAVKEAVVLYPNLFPNPVIKACEVSIPLYGHPKSLKETILGAKDRAKQAFKNCDYSFGIEGGLMKVPEVTTGYMETGVCAIYDGNKYYIGLSPAYEWPQKMLDLILSGKADGSQAFKQLGFTQHEKAGAQKGGIGGVLTKGRLPREDFTKYAIIMALIQLDQPEMYH